MANGQPLAIRPAGAKQSPQNVTYRTTITRVVNYSLIGGGWFGYLKGLEDTVEIIDIQSFDLEIIVIYFKVEKNAKWIKWGTRKTGHRSYNV